MRRFFWLGLVMWLGCGDASGGEESSTGLDKMSTAEATTTTPGSAASAPASNAAPAAAMSSMTAARGASGSATGTASAKPATAATAPMAAMVPSAAAPSGATPTTPASGGSAPSGESASDSAAGAPPPSDPAESGASKGPVADGQEQASVLTAGAWDDNRNFERFEKYRKKLADRQLSGMLPSTDEEHADANKAFTQPSPQEKLDVSLVIDTTGSMGDEIRYLQREFLALSSAIEEKYPNAEQRWSLVVYRDMGDEYITRFFDFSDNVMDFRDKLAEQSAGGGGDFPEAPDAALEAMAKLAWREDDKVARLAFWVADAPHHDNKAKGMLEAIRGARELGVHLYPVASSGVDELTEVSMRSAAQLTGGRYLFLTDDSGVGGAHKEPSIPCYFVTKLDKAILRMVSIEMSGTYAEPGEDDIIRTGGDPDNGSCKLDSGEVVEAF